MGRHTFRKGAKRRTLKKRPGLKTVNINNILKCNNKKYGCKLQAKQFTCYRRVKHYKNKSRADKIVFTNRKNKSKKITPSIRVGDTWYNCSHF